MNPSDIKQLQNVCMAIGELKSQQTEVLPHNGHQSLYFENDEITTGLVNNKTEIKIDNVSHGQLSEFYSYAIKAKRTIELFRMTLAGNFTLVHLWPHHLDFSVEWFTGKMGEQIGTGISPGDEQYKDPYLYMNPYPFNPKVTQYNLPIGKWHTSSWKGIKVDRDDLGNYSQTEVSDLLSQLFLIAKKNFE